MRLAPLPRHYSAQERALHLLRERIRGGVYPTGTLLPTERQLVEEIGISRPVVRAALQQLRDSGWITRDPGHRPRVAPVLPEPPETRDASGPETALQAIAALLPMEPRYPAAYNILRGIQRTLQRYESAHRLIVFDSLAGAPTVGEDWAAWKSENERRMLESAVREGIAGIVLWPAGGEETLPALRLLQDNQVPVVFVDRFPDRIGMPPCDFVGVDNRSGARTAVNYLIHLGHQRIAHLTLLGQGNEGAAVSVRERYEGYRDALWENGIPPDPALVCGTTAQVIERFRDAGVTAAFAVNDASAHRLIDVARAQGIRVPEELSVIGFDDLDRYSPQSAYLTTMHLPFEAVGERAAELLLQRLREPHREPPAPVVHTLLATTLISRSTCTTPPNSPAS